MKKVKGEKPFDYLNTGSKKHLEKVQHLLRSQKLS
jgi:hypothetical protein